MTRLSGIEGAVALDPGGEPLGTVERALFHPAEPRVVALMVRPTPAMLVVALPVAYVPWSDATFADGVVHFAIAKLPAKRRTGSTLGFDIDTTVIWSGMPVAVPDGERVGAVADAEIRADGSLERLDVSTGAAGDIAYGRLQVPGDAVAGFADGAVHLSVGVEGLVPSGGLARTAAQATEAIKSSAAAAATATGQAVVGASYATGRAIRTVVGAKPLKRTKSALRGIADAFREGYDDKPPGPEHPGSDAD